MKKIYLSSLIIATAFSGTCQSLGTTKADIKETANLEAPSQKPSQNIADEKALVYLWNEDFTGGTASELTANGQYAIEGTNPYWYISSGSHPLSSFGWTQNMTGEYLAWDSYNQITEPQGQFATTQVDGGFTSPTIDLTATTNSVGIEFKTEAYYCCNFNYTPFSISVSTDNGATWSDTLEFDFGIDRNVSTETIADPLEFRLNLDAIVAPNPGANFKFRFIWDGLEQDANGQYNSHYFWLIDDVAIYEIPDNDIALLKGWHNDVVNDWEYSMLPVAQSTVREMVPGVIIKNEGGLSQTLDVTCDILDPGMSIVSTTVINHTIAPGVVDTLWFSTGYMPSVVGLYSTEFSIPADDETSDDSFSASTLEVHANLMAHDYGSTDSYGWDPASTNQTTLDRAQAPHAYGNVYVPETDQEVYAIDVYFETGTTPGLYTLARIQEMTGPSIQDPLNYVVETDHTITAQEIGTVTTIVFPFPVNLVAGTSYIVDILKVDGTTTEGFYIGGSELSREDDDYSTVNWGPYGSGAAVNYYNGWGYAPYVRANFDMSLAVTEVELEGVSVYPNPSEGIVTITNDNNLNNVIEVSDISGKVILTKEVSTKTTIDLGGANGVYIIKISNDLGTTVKRVVIK